MSRELGNSRGETQWFDISRRIEEFMKKDKKLNANVDFYSAPLFYSLGIPVDLFTPVIAAGRIAGWAANIVEQHDDNRLIRPRADYVGPKRRDWVPREKR